MLPLSCPTSPVGTSRSEGQGCLADVTVSAPNLDTCWRAGLHGDTPPPVYNITTWRPPEISVGPKVRGHHPLR